MWLVLVLAVPQDLGEQLGVHKGRVVVSSVGRASVSVTWYLTAPTPTSAKSVPDAMATFRARTEAGTYA